MSSQSVRFDAAEFFSLCFAVARGVDYAVTIGDVPPISHRLPSLLKQVHRHKSEGALRPAIMMLMISAKNASKTGWFLAADTEDVLNMANELFGDFCMTKRVSYGIDSTESILGNLVSRFYPQFKVDRLICSFEAKLGYGVLISDFEISRNYPSEYKIMLIVVQTDNMETSSCIISPSQASVMINGCGVDGRTVNSPDSGPQIPSDVSKILKYGTNIIQAAGNFTGNYLIILAYMREVPLHDPPILPDYTQFVSEVAGADSDIIEGASRISLNCPISFKRIVTPVKGHLCKHHQCFDYDNYISMNLKKPSWRCPSCNQPVCFIDLRIDQNMVKIIKELDQDTTDVEISSDGSWKAISKKNGLEGQINKKKNMQGGQHCEVATETVDLTNEEENGVFQSENHVSEIRDRKPNKSSHDLPKQIGELNLQSNLPSFTTLDAPVRPTSSTRLNPINTYYHCMHALDNGNQPALEVTPLAECRQLQSQFWNPVASHEAERNRIPRYANRTPVAVQALEVPAQPTNSNKRMRVESSMTQPANNLAATTPASTNYSPISPPATTTYQPSPSTTLGQQNLARFRSLIGSYNRANSTLPIDASRELARRIAQRRTNNTQSGASPTVNLQPQVPRMSNLEPSLNSSPATTNWMPTGRMRGSLTGSAYSAAVNKYASGSAPHPNSSNAPKHT